MEDRLEWTFNKSEMPIGSFEHHGKGQQWAYQMGYKDGQKKLLRYQYRYVETSGIPLTVLGWIEALLRQLEN